MRIILEDWRGLIRIGGKRITNLRYSDDKLILVCSTKEMFLIMSNLVSINQEYGLILNKKKTQIKITDRHSFNIRKVRSVIETKEAETKKSNTDWH